MQNKYFICILHRRALTINRVINTLYPRTDEAKLAGKKAADSERGNLSTIVTQDELLDVKRNSIASGRISLSQWDFISKKVSKKSFFESEDKK